MKTNEIMTQYEYESVGGPIMAVPTADVLNFLQRILHRLSDIQDGMSIETFTNEIKAAKEKLGR